MRISIMQPYFIPYAGYFRLMTQADLFVIYDDVQFPYPGWVHRNMLTRYDGKKDWLTLPLKRKPLTTKINEMEWSWNAVDTWQDQLRKFPIFDDENSALKVCIKTAPQWGSPLRFIVKTLELVRGKLDINVPIVFSSHLSIPDELKGQDRVLHICEKFKAKEYLNAPGGRELYDAESFKKRNVKLKFLSEYKNYDSFFERLETEGGEAIRQEIDRHGSEDA